MRRFLLRLLGHDEIIADLFQRFRDVDGYVMSHALFADSQGNVRGQRNSDEILKQWREYYKLSGAFFDAVNKKDGSK